MSGTYYVHRIDVQSSDENKYLLKGFEDEDWKLIREAI